MSSLLAPAYGGATSINCLASPPTRNSFQLRASAFRGAPVLRRVALQPMLVSSSPRYRRSATCFFGGKGDAPENNDNDASLWKSFENAVGNFKNKSIDDVLREQIRQQELTGDGGSGGPPRGGGGGGDGSGDTEDEGFAGIIDEFFQVVFATLGVIILYMLIVDAEEVIDQAEDFIIYLDKVRTSWSLKSAMKIFQKRFVKGFWRMITRKGSRKVVRRKRHWLEGAILNAQTWWQNPKQRRRRMMPAK